MSKRIICFLSIVLVLCISGCSDSLLEQPDLSGTWELRKIIYGFTQVTNDSPPKETIVISSRQKSFKKQKRINYLVLDVDGVFTDGCVYYDANGELAKKFDMRDGMGLEILWSAHYY